MPAPAAVALPHRITLQSEAETIALARRIAPLLGPGDTLALSGEIGAGKSVFARAAIQTRLAALGLVEEVPSPTYTLVQTYEAGALEIWHADLYRLAEPDEGRELGLEAAFDHALCLIEWPERAGSLIPPTALWLQLAPGPGPDARALTLAAAGGDWPRRLAPLIGAPERAAADHA